MALEIRFCNRRRSSRRSDSTGSDHGTNVSFKAFARAMRVACSRDKQLGDMLPSTKGLL